MAPPLVSKVLCFIQFERLPFVRAGREKGCPSFFAPWSERRVNARNESFQSLYGGQFTLSTQLINPKFCVLRPHRSSSTVSLETNPLAPLFYVFVTVFSLDRAQTIGFEFCMSNSPIKMPLLSYSAIVRERKTKDCARSWYFQHKLQHLCYGL